MNYGLVLLYLAKFRIINFYCIPTIPIVFPDSHRILRISVVFPEFPINYTGFGIPGIRLFPLDPHLPKIIIYDAGCLLAKFIRNNLHLETTSNNANSALNILKNTRFFVDRFHLPNHRQVKEE